ncbi:toprim domain-containing protein [Mycoplasmopsis verecunda]|uniref:Recombination protein RecR n=1 Tax=Mycoplasmopsis verecunda TaxID=171291 RepID=A0A1T4L0G9_9BACT|nr:toprim domain-containing protein [Mycoplasmopsis verecunda]WPB54402.1 toprim domain-containing protein [Mycoplasmopsis verecunda]SJZ48195.1 DNA replication and repair protein RecR [Mycoplasmopsis verecunda]
MFYTDDINTFIAKAKKIPGISKKQAEKIVYWILESEQNDVFELSKLIQDIKIETKFCPICTNLMHEDKCSICDNPERSNSLFVIENLQAMKKIEDANFYNGKYYILPFMIEKERDVVKYQNEINEFVKYASSFDEIILGISPTLKGEITNKYLKVALQNANLNVTKLAIGVPLGSSLDYMDEITIKFALNNRQK